MRIEFLGDSYDIVKRFLLRSVAPDAEWMAFPMFTHEVTTDDISAFEAFLNVRVVSSKALTISTDRAKHLLAPADHRHIFLDPDTGIKLKPSNGADSVKYVFGPELIALCQQDPNRLLLVFDQSVPRGGERKAIEEKLKYFHERNICGFAYLSHACFVVLSGSETACLTARLRLLASNLPSSRLVGAADA